MAIGRGTKACRVFVIFRASLKITGKVRRFEASGHGSPARHPILLRRVLRAMAAPFLKRLFEDLYPRRLLVA